MDEHPGDSLGKRFLTFWGSILAILAFGILVYIVKSLFGPSSGDELDGGLAQNRLGKKSLVDKEQAAEIEKYAFDKAKQVVAMPPAELTAYAASVLSKQKETKSKVAVPGAVPPPAPPAAPPDSGKSTAPTASGDAVSLTLGVLPGVMQFDKKELEAPAGAKVALTFQNAACPLLHNFILLKPGTKDKVGALADASAASPNAVAELYIPASPDILAKSTKLVGLGQSDLINFTAPTAPGEYPYICTFPGHWRLMFGVLKIK